MACLRPQKVRRVTEAFELDLAAKIAGTLSTWLVNASASLLSEWAPASEFEAHIHHWMQHH